MSKPSCNVYTRCQVPSCSVHFCSPAVASSDSSATLVWPLTIRGATNPPSPSSHTYKLFSFAQKIPNGNITGWPVLPSCATPLASVVGKPGKTMIGAVLTSVGVGSAPAFPTRYTVLIPLPPLPLVTYIVLLKIVSP